MYERAMTFNEYIGFYKLNRSEGLVLRYLSDAYRAARQTIPAEAKNEELLDLIEWLGELVHQVDSSLLDEWEELINPAAIAGPEAPVRPAGAAQRRLATPGRSGSWCATNCSGGCSWRRSAGLRDARRAGRPERIRRRRLGGRAGGRTSPSTTGSARTRMPAVRR